LKTGVQSYFIQYWYEETNAILNLQPQYQEIAKYKVLADIAVLLFLFN